MRHTSLPHPPIPLLLLAASAIASASSAAAASSPPSSSSSSSSSTRPQKILLSDVQLLTLRGNNALTAHRRVPSVPQLRCISPPPLCALHAIDIMRCTNEGSSYGAEDIEWSCRAELPPELALAATDVVCEGFRDEDDPYVLRGSCGVEYALRLTALGEQTYPDVARATVAAAADAAGAEDGAAATEATRKPFFDDGRGGEDLSAWLFALIFVAVCAWIVYSAWLARTWTPPSSQAVTRSRRAIDTVRFDDDNTNNNNHDDDDDDDDKDDRVVRRNARGARGGWNPGWGLRGPPPPYSDRRADYVSSKRDHYDRRAHDPVPDHAYPPPRRWTPGFWSGLTGGSAAGYVAGRNSTAMSGAARPRPGWDEPDYRAPAWEAEPFVPRPSAAAGRSYSTSRPEPVHSHSQSGGSGSATTGRSERHESTGYGSTRRR